MPLNKFASFGVAPGTSRPPGLTAITRNGLAAINATLVKLAPAPAPIVKTPSATALRIVWSLNAVRDALSDQGDPNVGDTNDQIANRADSDAVREIADYLEGQHPELAELYSDGERGQFRPLVAGAGDTEAFDLERRERFAELATFELLVMATVADYPPATAPTPAPARVRARAIKRSR